MGLYLITQHNFFNMKKTSRRLFYGVPLHLIGFMVQDVPKKIMREKEKKIDLFLNALSLRTLQGRQGRFLAGKDAIVAATSRRAATAAAVFYFSKSSQGPSLD